MIMLFLMDVGIGAGSGLVLSVPALLWLEKERQKKGEKKPWHTVSFLPFALETGAHGGENGEYRVFVFPFHRADAAFFHAGDGY